MTKVEPRRTPELDNSTDRTHALAKTDLDQTLRDRSLKNDPKRPTESTTKQAAPRNTAATESIRDNTDLH